MLVKRLTTYPLKFVMFAKNVPFAKTEIAVDNGSSFVMSTFPQGVLVDGR